MRRSLWLVLISFLAFVPTAHADAAAPPTIDVTGEGEVKVEPDEVLIRLGIETFGPKLKEVQQAIADRSQALLDGLKSRGVKSADVQTELVQITPQYDFDKAKRRFIEYTARKNFLVTLHGVENYGETLEKALEVGVDHVDGLEFRSSKISALKDGARKLAVQDARRKAEQMAGVLGQTTGRALHIQEQQTDLPHPVMIRAAAAEAFKGGGVHDAVAPGELTIRSTVYIQFELK